MKILKHLQRHIRLRQDLLRFILIGGLQFLIDALLLVAMARAGLAVAIANIISRALAACCGYYLNGKFSFAGDAPTITKRSLRRFWVLWISLTLFSSALIAGIQWLNHGQTGNPDIILLTGKLLIEAMLFMLSFALCKYWVYR